MIIDTHLSVGRGAERCEIVYKHTVYVRGRQQFSDDYRMIYRAQFMCVASLFFHRMYTLQNDNIVLYIIL